MLQKLRSKKGFFVLEMYLGFAALCAVIDVSMRQPGRWGYLNGVPGTWALEVRQAAIEANGGHINNKDRWYESASLKP